MKVDLKKRKLFLLIVFVFVFFTLSTPTFAAVVAKKTLLGLTLTDDGTTVKASDGTDLTSFYSTYRNLQLRSTTSGDLSILSTGKSSDGRVDIETYTTKQGETIIVKRSADDKLTMHFLTAGGGYTDFDSSMKITANQGSDYNFVSKFVVKNLLPSDGNDYSQLPVIGNTQLQTLVNNKIESSSGATYLNDASSTCSTTGCTYTLMAPIGGFLGDSNGVYTINKDDKDGLCTLLNSWFRIGIALAGMLAVVMIVLGGFQYATTDSLFDKSDGKGKIQNALWGLLLALTTWLILETINPALTKCTIDAGEVQLSALAAGGTQSGTSGALGGGVMGLGLTAAGNALSAAGTQSKSAKEIEDEYNQAYAQWTDEDDRLLAEDPNNAGLLEKWNGIQFQIDSLNNTYAKASPSGGSGSSGTANQKILTQIANGDCSHSAHCFSSAEDLATNAGVKYSSVYQNDNYVVGGKTLKSFGSERMPTAGEMVDVYTGGAKKSGYPFHTVILDHYNSSGQAVVWDWENNKKTGLRTMDFTLDDSKATTKGYIGRIYVPSNK